MGKNWLDHIIEIKRCLSTRGFLFIEVTTHELDEGRRLHSLPNILKIMDLLLIQEMNVEILD